MGILREAKALLIYGELGEDGGETIASSGLQWPLYLSRGSRSGCCLKNESYRLSIWISASETWFHSLNRSLIKLKASIFFRRDTVSLSGSSNISPRLCGSQNPK